MKKIYSKIEPNKLLHIIVRKDDLIKGRTEVVSEEHFIQCALLNMEKDKTFKPHKHIWKNRTRDVIAQESWVVIQGKVRCTFFDIDDNIIAEPKKYSYQITTTLVLNVNNGLKVIYKMVLKLQITLTIVIFLSLYCMIKY